MIYLGKDKFLEKVFVNIKSKRYIQIKYFFLKIFFEKMFE